MGWSDDEELKALTAVLISVQVVLLWIQPSLWRTKQNAELMDVMESLIILLFSDKSSAAYFDCPVFLSSTWKTTWVVAERTIFDGFCAPY